MLQEFEFTQIQNDRSHQFETKDLRRTVAKSRAPYFNPSFSTLSMTNPLRNQSIKFNPGTQKRNLHFLHIVHNPSINPGSTHQSALDPTTSLPPEKAHAKATSPEIQTSSKIRTKFNLKHKLKERVNPLLSPHPTLFD